jgi:hypothetical protein
MHFLNVRRTRYLGKMRTMAGFEPVLKTGGRMSKGMVTRASSEEGDGGVMGAGIGSIVYGGIGETDYDRSVRRCGGGKRAAETCSS